MGRDVGLNPVARDEQRAGQVLGGAGTLHEAGLDAIADASDHGAGQGAPPAAGERRQMDNENGFHYY